jgi:erythronate-4-phosphate dehydrogenase
MKNMKKILIDKNIPFIKNVFEPYAKVVYMRGDQITSADIADVDALIIRTRTRCNEELLSGSSVKFIATATIGYDHIDTEWCEANGIEWINVPGCNSGSVKQYMASVLTTLAKHFGFNFQGKVFGVVGVGNVGSKVVDLARILGMTVIMNDPLRAEREGAAKFVPFSEILDMSDIISLHVPLIKTGMYPTYHLFDAGTLDCLRRSTILINTSRGEVIDNDALKNALINRIPGAAVLDVFENEPNIDLELLKILSIATPHIAGYSIDGKIAGTRSCVRAVSRFFELPLTDWTPPFVPPPAQPISFELDCSGKDLQKCLCEVIWHTYTVNDDDGLLRGSPNEFETFRENYAIRREFEAFTVELKNPIPEIEDKLWALGFSIKKIRSKN